MRLSGDLRERVQVDYAVTATYQVDSAKLGNSFIID